MKRFFSVFLALLMIFSSVSVISYATESKESIPWIFVHGMNGYGENSDKNEDTPYWGKDDTDLLNYLRGEGYEVYAPTIGPLSSSWDRACELYAQLTGTVVDYGEAHAEKYGHSRYGRDYTGKATMGEPWDMKSEINLIAHSLGGPTARIFVSLLSYGSEEEKAASQDNMSPLFEGGHAESINALVTLSAPHNGTPLADIAINTGLIPSVVVLVAAVAKNTVNGFFMLDQWNIVDENGRLSVKNAKNFGKADNSGTDITMKGAAEITEKYKLPDNVLYLSYSATTTKEGLLGHQIGMPAGGVYTLTSSVISMCANFSYDGVVPGKDWESNDGLVPVISAQYPAGDPLGHVNYTEGMELQRGTWTVMPTITGTHSYFTGAFGGSDGYTQFFTDIFELAATCK